MIDTLLYAVRDGIRSAGFGYDKASCEIMDNGKPPPRCGNFFVSVHSGRSKPGSANGRNLHELFGFSVTLTMRITVPLDRVGDQQIARNLALVPLGLRQGFNAKVEQLRGYLHMNWGITVLTGQTPASANDNISAWATGTVYGFFIPAAYQGETIPRLEGAAWFAAEDPESDEVGIVCELQYDGAERFQPQTLPVGPFV